MPDLTLAQVWRAMRQITRSRHAQPSPPDPACHIPRDHPPRPRPRDRRRPEHRTWNIDDRDGLYCGFWQSTPGTWEIRYDEWEYCHILEGISVLTDASGQTQTFRAGDSFVIRPGFAGTWCVVETTLKEYVIRT